MPKGDAQYEAERTLKELDQNIAGMSYNAFQRELQRMEIEPRMARLMTLLFERQTEIAKQCGDCMTLLGEFAKSIEGFVQLSEANNKKMQAMAQRIGMVKSEDIN